MQTIEDDRAEIVKNFESFQYPSELSKTITLHRRNSDGKNTSDYRSKSGGMLPSRKNKNIFNNSICKHSPFRKSFDIFNERARKSSIHYTKFSENFTQQNNEYSLPSIKQKSYKNKYLGKENRQYRTGQVSKRKSYILLLRKPTLDNLLNLTNDEILENFRYLVKSQIVQNNKVLEF